MPTDRRDFIKLSASAAALAALAGLPLARAAANPSGRAPGGDKAPSPDAGDKAAPTVGAAKKLSILILGGTEFVGPHVIEAARARGHTVTLFNRGRRAKRKPGRFDSEEIIIGNRDPEKRALAEMVDGKEVEDSGSPKGLTGLREALDAGKKFDAVVDTSGYFPRIVKASADLLAPHVQHYVFISTVSVYAKNDQPHADETAETGKVTDATKETMGAQMELYGPFKALCEQAAEAAMPGRVMNIRPGFIVGPDDPSDRFTYWPWRAAQGGTMLAPGAPSDPVQFIDVRDLAEFIVRGIEHRTAGVFNATGTLESHKWGDVLEACRKAAAPEKPVTLKWVSADDLEKKCDLHDGALPIWLPPTGETAGFHRVNVSRAVKAGLAFRPVDVTVRDTLAWLPKELARREKVTQDMRAEAKAAGKPEPKMGDPKRLRAGLTLEEEAEGLAKAEAKPAIPTP
ncbi:hypothetical protein BH11PLA1_BH11PLA1_19760 [soil metagenome]